MHTRLAFDMLILKQGMPHRLSRNGVKEHTYMLESGQYCWYSDIWLLCFAELVIKLANGSMEIPSEAAFLRQKQQSLGGTDWSRKGSIDEHIVNLVKFINEQPSYFTTSSCSGRVCVFEELGSTIKKKDCRWLHTTHEKCAVENVLAAIEQSKGDAVFKFEPFVLHVQCFSLADAQIVQAASVAAGFRNSGLSYSRKGKIIAAVRSTHSLEVPLTHQGNCLVSGEYVMHLVQLANTKMDENLVRIQRFFQGIKQALEKEVLEGSTSKQTRRQKDLSRSNRLTESDCLESKYSSSEKEINDVCLNDCTDWFMDQT